MKTRMGDFNKYGLCPTKDGMMFTFASEGEGECAVLLFHRKDKSLLERIVLPAEYSIGDMHSVVIQGRNWHTLCYLYEQDGKEFLDLYAPKICGRDHWADSDRSREQYRVYGGFPEPEYHWQNLSPAIAPGDMIMYKLHMRGYTMRHGLPASQRGNYKGILEKLPELKELGVTSLEFQPIYDFEELRYEKRSVITATGETKEEYHSLDKINYWGYGEASYLAPKASYFGGKDSISHCREMIDAIHGMGMEVIMEMSFVTEVSDDFMMDALWYWVREFHVDGFHLLGCNAPIRRIAENRGLASTKIFYEVIPREILEKEKNRKHLFLYNDYFMHVTRQIQNHMGGSMVQFTNHLRRQNDAYGFVNYVANTDGFTLLDSYSYGEKHNEANGEENKDGVNTNFSFNYGVEGATKQRQIQQMRMRQVRNGLCCVMLAQAVPLLRSGDEVLNTQEGNNNPYCQDNPLGWVSYGRNHKNKVQLFRFIQKLLAFRKAHPVLSMEKAFRMTDYRHCGLPDISYHGAEPWLMSIGEEQRAVGILYAGAYAKDENNDPGENVYVAYNFHYDQVQLALPSLSGGNYWRFVMNTAQEDSFSFLPKKAEDQRTILVPGSSISIYVS